MRNFFFIIFFIFFSYIFIFLYFLLATAQISPSSGPLLFCLCCLVQAVQTHPLVSCLQHRLFFFSCYIWTKARPLISLSLRMPFWDCWMWLSLLLLFRDWRVCHVLSVQAVLNRHGRRRSFWAVTCWCCCCRIDTLNCFCFRRVLLSFLSFSSTSPMSLVVLFFS